MKRERNSNYELMRIVSMFMIVVYHIIMHGHVFSNYQNEGAILVTKFIFFMTVVHVNSFVLVSGYFQCNSKFKQSKLWSIINQSLFYRIVIMSIFILMGLVNLNKVEIFKEVAIIDITEYWFIKTYLFLYCLTPFINKFIEALNKKSYQKLLILLLVLFSIIPTVTGGGTFDNSGYSLYSFIFLYLVGSYFRKYPLKEMYIFRPMSKRLYQIFMIVIFITACSLNFILTNYMDKISDINLILGELNSYTGRASIAYSNPLIIIQTIAYFEFFSTLNIKNKIINKIASLTLGVYMIHDNNFVRANIYKWLKIDNGPIYSYKFIIYIFAAAVVIYVACSLIEYLRKLLFSFIYKLKISEKVRNKYYQTINEINLSNP